MKEGTTLQTSWAQPSSSLRDSPLLSMGILEILLTSFLHYRVFFSYENQVAKIKLTKFIFENFIHLLRNTVFREVK